MRKLRELYLRGNQIAANLEELEHLSSLKSLRVLNLAENPVSSSHGGLPHYRLCVLHFAPWLEKLDDVDVTPDEVNMATSIELDQLVRMIDNETIQSEKSVPRQEAQKPHVHTTFDPSES